MPYSNKYDATFQYICHILINMMPYSNIYDAIPICRTHARSLCVHPNFQATTRATSDNFVACGSRCRSLCVHTLTRVYTDAAAFGYSSTEYLTFLPVATGPILFRRSQKKKKTITGWTLLTDSIDVKTIDGSR